MSGRDHRRQNARKSGVLGRRSNKLTVNHQLRFESLEQRAVLCSVPLYTGTIINEANGHTYCLLEASTWTEAEAAAKELGGNLVTINDAAEDAWVRETFGDSNQFGLWTGLNDQQTEGEFVWTSGEPVTYANWASGQPDNYNGVEDFVMLYTDGGGRWADYSNRATTAGRPLQGVVEIPSFVNPTNGHTYIKLSPSTWPEADARSIELGGHLVTINDSAEQEWVFETFSADSQFGLWIGLNDRNQEGQFVWSSGQPVTYTNWGSEQPDNFNGDEDFAMMLVEDDGAWYPDYAYEGGTTGRPLHGIMEYEGIRNWQTGGIIPGTEVIPPGPSIRVDGWNTEDHNLRYADFSHRNLTQASFVGADLSNALFNDATLIEADLTNADLTSGTLTDADMRDAFVAGASFLGATDRGFTASQLYSTQSYKLKELPGISFGRTLVPGQPPTNTDLSGWNFDGQNLTQASFRFTLLADAVFRLANLQDANFQSAKLMNVDFASADLTGATLSVAHLSGATLDDAAVTAANFLGTTDRGLTKEQIYSTASYRSGNLEGIGLSLNDLSNWDLSGQRLERAMFHDSALSDANLRGALIQSAEFDASGLSETQLASTASYVTGDLMGVSLRYMNLVGWDFARQNLTSASFRNSNLSEADLSEANLERVDFKGSRLERANLQAASLRDSDFNGCWDQPFFDGVSFKDANLRDADLSGAVFVCSYFDRADFTDVELGNASFTEVGFTKEQIYSTANYNNHDFGGVEFFGQDLKGFDLSSQDFLGAVLSHVDLDGADLRDARLSNTLIAHSTLDGTRLEAANLRNAVLESANNVVNAVFSDRTAYNQWTVFPESFDPQFHGLTFKLAGAGDLDGLDGLSPVDLDLLNARVRDPSYIHWQFTMFDLNGDLQIDEADTGTWIKDIAGTRRGDSNLDQQINFSDFLDLSRNFGDSGGWAEGDFNADGEVNFADFLLLSRNFGWEASATAVDAVFLDS